MSIIPNVKTTPYTEVYKDSKGIQQYLNIHKNACSTVRQDLEMYLEGVCASEVFIEGPPRWTVLRDPYERFLSGLAYDLRHTYLLPSFEDTPEVVSVLKRINYTQYMTGNVNPFTRVNGSISHGRLQTLYLFNANIDVYIDIRDLDNFRYLHFGGSISTPVNKGISEDILHVKEAFESLRREQAIVHSLLEIDYVTISNMRYQGRNWSWEKGAIFTI